MLFEAFPTNQLSNNVFLIGDDSRKMLDKQRATWEKKTRNVLAIPFVLLPFKILVSLCHI
jgi:hypothetical protein